MNIQEVWDKAREVMAPKCRVCPECNGKACKGEIPGLGGIGNGSSFTVCREYLSRVKVLMNLVYEPNELDTSIELFGRRFAMPIFMAPIGGMDSNYNGYMTDEDFANMSIRGMVESGSLAFTPDGFYDRLFELQLPIIKDAGGCAVPTIKPWETNKLLSKIRQAEEANALAVACDMDSCWSAAPSKACSPFSLYLAIHSRTMPLLTPNSRPTSVGPFFPSMQHFAALIRSSTAIFPLDIVMLPP